MRRDKTFDWGSVRNTYTLLFIMFIDGVGMSLVLPLISDLFSSGPNSIIALETSRWLENLYYGGSLACFSGAMIIGAVVLGQLSDRNGRKHTLYLALIGAIFGYLLCAIAVLISSPVLFLLGRIIDGLTAGSIPIAQAMLSDVDNRPNKMVSIAKVMFAVTSGYMFGPVIASIAFSLEFSAFYLPFILIAICCAVCMILLSAMHYPEQKGKHVNDVDLMIAFKQIKSLLQVKNLRRMLIGFFLFQCAWTLFYQYLPKMGVLIASIPENFSIVLMTEVGIGMCFAFCFLIPKVQAIFSLKKLVAYCIFLFALMNALFITISMSYWLFQLISICMAILYAIGYSAMLALMLLYCNDDQKGLIFGSVASICAISATLTALLGSTITTLNYHLFFLVLLGLSVTVCLLFTKKINAPLIEMV